MPKYPNGLSCIINGILSRYKSILVSSTPFKTIWKTRNSIVWDVSNVFLSASTCVCVWERERESEREREREWLWECVWVCTRVSIFSALSCFHSSPTFFKTISNQQQQQQWCTFPGDVVSFHSVGWEMFFLVAKISRPRSYDYFQN